MFNTLFAFSLNKVAIVLKITMKGILNKITISVLTENKFPIINVLYTNSKNNIK